MSERKWPRGMEAACEEIYQRAKSEERTRGLINHLVAQIAALKKENHRLHSELIEVTNHRAELYSASKAGVPAPPLGDGERA